MMLKYPQVLKAIKTVRSQVCWKHNSAVRHLHKRKQRGHLSSRATLEDYERIILTVLHDKTGRVYRYWYNGISYVTVVATVANQEWLVMFAYDGVLESAFVVERPERYLNKPGFEWIGLLNEVDNEL
jgi:hypothetical protein